MSEHGKDKVDIHSYRKRFTTYTALPQNGLSRDAVLGEVAEMKRLEESRWKSGYASGAVYNGDDAHIEFLNKVYALPRGIDVYKVLDAMTDRGWRLNGLHKPASIHLCVTLRHTEPGVADRFLGDLRSSIEFVKANPDAAGGQAPIYGMANTLPDRGFIAEAMRDYMDGWYKTD